MNFYKVVPGGIFFGKFSLLGWALVFRVVHPTLANEWTLQGLRLPPGSNGDTNGVVLTDLNYDGAIDLVFCGSSTDSSEQPYALMNQGYREGIFQFSDPLPIGPPGVYSKCDVQWLPDHDSVGVLLGGGSCEGTCGTSNPNQSAVLLTVNVEDCVFVDPGECILTSSQIWQDSSPQGNTNAAFLFLDDGNPAIVLSSKTSISVFESNSGVYSSAPAFTMPVKAGEEFAALSTGMIRRNPGFFAGSFSDSSGTLLAVSKTGENGYVQEEIDSSHRISDVDLVSIRRGQQLVIPTNFETTSVNPSVQSYFLVGNTIEKYEIFESDDHIVANAMGMVFENSTLPDAVFATGKRHLKVFRNEGVDPATSQFRGFSEETTLKLPSPCRINDLKVSPIWPCTVSVVVATRKCPAGSANYMYTMDTCDFEEFLEGLGSPSSPASPSAPFSPSSPSSPIFIAPRPSSRPSSSPTLTQTPSVSPSSVEVETMNPTPSVNSGNDFAVVDGEPSEQPTISLKPSSHPTMSLQPSTIPTHSKFPSISPTFSSNPSSIPTYTIHPSSNPTVSTQPSSGPTVSIQPSGSPTSSMYPSANPTVSMNPSESPTTTNSPSLEPTSSIAPSVSPSTIEDHLFHTKSDWSIPSQNSSILDEKSLIIIICGAILVIVLLIALGVARWSRLEMKKAQILKQHEDGYKSSSTNSGSGGSRCEEAHSTSGRSTFRKEAASSLFESDDHSENRLLDMDREVSEEYSEDELVCISFEDEDSSAR